MTRTARVAAPDTVSRIPREAARLGLELRPEMLRSRAALPHLVIDDSLIPSPHCPGYHHPPMRRVRRSPPSGVRFHGRFMVFPHRSRSRAMFSCPASAPAYAIALGCTAVYGFRMVPAKLGRTSRYDRSAQKMGNGVPCWSRANASHSTRTFSGSPDPGGCSPEGQGARPAITTSRPRIAAGRRPDDDFGTTPPPA